MRLLFVLVLLLGLGLAGAAVYMAKDYVGDYQAQLERERAAREAMVPTVDVIVVNERIAYGERLEAEDVRIVKWPENAVPEGAFQSADGLFPQGPEIPRTVIRTMEKDEAVLAAKVTDPGEDAGVSSRLGAGMRAFAIRVDVSTGVSGFLRPGDRVDVYWTGGSRDGDVTKLIQPGIRLIAIDQIADEDRANPVIARTVTVEATPQQVATLAQAQSTGRLSLALVGAEDETVASAVEVDQRTLLGLEEVQVIETEQEEICTIRTRRGADIIETRIPCGP